MCLCARVVSYSGARRLCRLSISGLNFSENVRNCHKRLHVLLFIFSELVVVNMRNLQHNLSFLLGTVLNLIVLSYAKDEDLKCGGKI